MSQAISAKNNLYVNFFHNHNSQHWPEVHRKREL